eukprot:gene5237-6518_t
MNKFIYLSILFIICILQKSVYSATDLSDCFDSRSTWYEAVEHGNCGYGPLMGPTGPGHRMIAAAATQLYNQSATCGECFHIYGPEGETTVVIVDQCPDPGYCDTSFPHLDLSPQAFQAVGGPNVGVIQTTVKKVSCDYVKGNINAFMKDSDTTEAWFEFMVYNHKVGLKNVDIETVDGKVIPLLRRSYNYWTYNQGGAKFPIIARVYSIYGERVDIYIDTPKGGVIHQGSGQYSEPASEFKDSCKAPLSIDSSGYIYNNGLVKPMGFNHPNLGWTDWSHGANVNWADTTTSGADADSKSVCSASIAPQNAVQVGTDLAVNWDGLFTNLEFYVKGDSDFTGLVVEFGGKSVATPVTGSWTKFSYSLATDLEAPKSLGKPNVLKFRNAGSSSVKLYLDKVRLTPTSK